MSKHSYGSELSNGPTGKRQWRYVCACGRRGKYAYHVEDWSKQAWRAHARTMARRDLKLSPTPAVEEHW